MEDLSKRIQVYWNVRSKAFNEVRIRELHSKNAQAWAHLLLPHLEEAFQNLEDEGEVLRLLDIGTGPGFFIFLLEPYMRALGLKYNRSYELIGIDSSQEMILRAQENAKAFISKAQFLYMDAQQPNFKSDFFHLALTRNVTWVLEDVKGAYASWYTVLKKGGRLLNFDSNYGKVNFAAHEPGVHTVHEDLQLSLRQECTAIKDELAISEELRPYWDMTCLHNLGFAFVDYKEDIREDVQVDETLQYEDIPIFHIVAIK